MGKLSQKGRCIPIRVNDTDRQHKITDTPQKSVYIPLVFTTVCTHVFATRFQFYFNCSLQSCGIHWIPVPFRWIPLDSTGFRWIPPEWPDSDRNRGGTVKYCQAELKDINQYVKSSNFGLVESNGAWNISGWRWLNHHHLHQWYVFHWDERESVKHVNQGSSASGKTLKHLPLTHTHYTHTTTISVQEFGAFEIEKYHMCLKSQLFRFITGFMYLIASVVLRPHKQLDMLRVIYKSSRE